MGDEDGNGLADCADGCTISLMHLEMDSVGLQWQTVTTLTTMEMVSMTVWTQTVPASSEDCNTYGDEDGNGGTVRRMYHRLLRRVLYIFVRWVAKPVVPMVQTMTNMLIDCLD